jgi:hypothetical protein
MERISRSIEELRGDTTEFGPRFAETVTPEFLTAEKARHAEEQTDIDRLEAELRALPGDVPAHIVALMDRMDTYPRYIACEMLIRLDARAVVPALCRRLERRETPPFPASPPKPELKGWPGRIYQRFVERFLLRDMLAETRAAERCLDKQWTAYVLSRLGDARALPYMERFLTDADERLRTRIQASVNYLRENGRTENISDDSAVA